MADVDVSDIAEAVGESEENIIRSGVNSYVSRELKEAYLRIKELKKKFEVDNSDELESKIEEGEIEEHPAWEALIEWKNLEKRIRSLEQF